MVSGLEALLRAGIPGELAAFLRREGIEPHACRLIVSTDLNLSGAYEPVWLLAEPDAPMPGGPPCSSPSWWS